MKFKKIEIQAFRAYNKVEDGTFDFITKSGEIADFISIYAPNGSGKTSFYDAIEWGFTRNISRFLRRRDDDKNFAKTEERNFRIRNKFAEINTDSVVRLHTTFKDQPFEEKIGTNRLGFRFDERATIKGREYFRHVLLSQEWIDAFLKEDDASIRYEKFVRSFGDVKLNRKYKTIIELLKLNNNKINELAQELKELQSKMNLDFDNEILSKINSEIEVLNKSGENMPVVGYNWSEKQIQQLSDLISERIIDLKYDIRKTFEEYFVKSEFEIDLSRKEKNEIEFFIKEKNDSCKKTILKLEGLILSFEKTNKYKDVILPFLKYVELQRTIDILQAKKSFLEKKVNPKLKREQRKIAKYIDSQIELFFNMKLISMLYQKIDPHPIHEEIKFKCDFSTDKPQLNAFVIEKEEGIRSIVPSLYFSAAQLNALSLSLVLAKALKVKDNKGNAVDCIFIDDPIQSMDSMNILSMIDLLRSISVNLGKQIFLATCDENLYNLLQKKIPANRFNAKYIEFETFGKVKS